MKIKEICQRTGLTEKAVRYYEEHGLVEPEKTIVAGRLFRSWSEEDAARLGNIALLRHAGFTVEQIGAILADPGEIKRILPNYLNALEAEVAAKNKVLQNLRGACPESVEQLAGALRSGAAGRWPDPHWADEEAPLAKKARWYWAGLLPRHLNAQQTILVSVLWQKPLPLDLLYYRCLERDFAVDAEKIAKEVRRLTRAGVLTRDENDCYTCQRADMALTGEELATSLGNMLAGPGLYFTNVPPMNCLSSGGKIG